MEVTKFVLFSEVGASPRPRYHTWVSERIKTAWFLAGLGASDLLLQLLREAEAGGSQV